MISGTGEMLVNKRKEVKKKEEFIVVPSTGPAAWSKQLLSHVSGPWCFHS